MQSVFKRYETKYLLTPGQYAAISEKILLHMNSDSYGEYLVQNLYFDTKDWDVIQASLEKPRYKEKLRLRCYGTPEDGSHLFLELKKKYDSVVYKRRIAFEGDVLKNTPVRAAVSDEPSQISRELEYYLLKNAVSEKIYISYHRTAFAGISDEGLRVTFDSGIRFRLDRLGFSNPDEGQFILPRDYTLMEIKALGGMPLWLARGLSEQAVFPTSFSKYGECYTGYIQKNVKSNEGSVKISA
jgi:SPX domain protein involved in polyphosphate accumulation